MANFPLKIPNFRYRGSKGLVGENLKPITEFHAHRYRSTCCNNNRQPKMAVETENADISGTMTFHIEIPTASLKFFSNIFCKNSDALINVLAVVSFVRFMSRKVTKQLSRTLDRHFSIMQMPSCP